MLLKRRYTTNHSPYNHSIEGIPLVTSYGFSGDHNVLVMELLGKSLETLFQEHSKRFSLKTVCMLGIQMVRRIQWVHHKNIVHRDIKPDNFVMGLNNKSHIVYILDFGLSKKYYSVQAGKHIKFKLHKKLTGTARYASINAIRGGEQSRKDDLEAIGYVLIYFLKGVLPWQGLRMRKNDDKYKVIYEKKRDTTCEELCEGCPNEFMEYVKYTRNLQWEEKPNYTYLCTLFGNVMKREGMECDWCFDWMSEVPDVTGSLVDKYHTMEMEGEKKKGVKRSLTERNEEDNNGDDNGKKKKNKEGCVLV